MGAIYLTRQVILRSLELSFDRHCILDSLPFPAIQFHFMPSSTGDWEAYDTTFGKAVTKNQTFFGYRLHLLISMSDLIQNFELSSA